VKKSCGIFTPKKTGFEDFEACFFGGLIFFKLLFSN
jgi:hypothetical protein